MSTPLLQGTARVLCGDLDGADAFFSDAEAVEQERTSPDMVALTLCERSLVAMARHQWDQAGALASRAHTHLRQAGIEDSYAAALTSALQARAAVHRADVPAARRELITALRLRPLMTYANPHWAVQLRIALIRVHLALSDLAGARTLMAEIEEIIGSSAVCLEWSAGRALGAGATKDEIADVLLAIAPVAGIGRVVSAAPQVATALEYDIEAALGEPDDR